MPTDKTPRFMWEKEGAMSIDVGRLVPFLKETACMNPREREIIGVLEYIKERIPDPKFGEFIDNWVISLVKKLGYAKWKRDVVSDLGFAKALKLKKSSKLGNKSLKWKPKQKPAKPPN